MTLEEIKQGNPAEQRVKRMKANAKSAKDRAKQLPSWIATSLHSSQ